MTPKALQQLALSFPEAHEEPHFERTSYRVGKKIFATMSSDGEEAMVKATPDGAAALLEMSPEVFFSYGTWTTRGGSLGVRLPQADGKLMRQLLLEAWRGVASKRALAAFESAPVKPGPKSKRATRGRVG